MARLDAKQLVQEVDPVTGAAPEYVGPAHMSLRQVDWSIRHHTPVDTALWLDFTETRMR